MNALIGAIWWTHSCLLHVTHRRLEDKRCWAPRPWAKRLHLHGHPWLWCECGDGLSTWEQVRAGKCWTCMEIEEELPK